MKKIMSLLVGLSLLMFLCWPLFLGGCGAALQKKLTALTTQQIADENAVEVWNLKAQRAIGARALPRAEEDRLIWEHKQLRDRVALPVGACKAIVERNGVCIAQACGPKEARQALAEVEACTTRAHLAAECTSAADVGVCLSKEGL